MRRSHVPPPQANLEGTVGPYTSKLPLSVRIANLALHREQKKVVVSNQPAIHGTQARHTHSKQHNTPATLLNQSATIVHAEHSLINEYQVDLHLHWRALLLHPCQSPGSAKRAVNPLRLVPELVKGRNTRDCLLLWLCCCHGRLGKRLVEVGGNLLYRRGAISGRGLAGIVGGFVCGPGRVRGRCRRDLRLDGRGLLLLLRLDLLLDGRGLLLLLLLLRLTHGERSWVFLGLPRIIAN